MKPERSQATIAAAEAQAQPQSWEVRKAAVCRTYALPTSSHAVAFAAFVERMSVHGGSSEASLTTRGNELTVEISSVIEHSLFDAEHQLAQAADDAYDLFVGNPKS